MKNAREETEKPSLIIIRSHIGYGAPDKQDTPEAHGPPLGEDEVKATKEFYDWPSTDTFYVPDDVVDHMSDAVQKGETEENTWNVKMEDYRKKYPELADKFQRDLKRELPDGWDKDIPHFKPGDGPIQPERLLTKSLIVLHRIFPGLLEEAPISPRQPKPLLITRIISKRETMKTGILPGA